MSKSIYAIGGMGLGTCIVLSLVMQHLLKVKQDHARPPLAIEVEELLGSRVCGRVEADTQQADGKVVTTVHLKVLAGLQKRRLVESIQPFLWQRLAMQKDPPDLLRFLVADDGDGAVETVELHRTRGGLPPARAAGAGQQASSPPARPAGH